jgi:hypothetical protein
MIFFSISRCPGRPEGTTPTMMTTTTTTLPGFVAFVLSLQRLHSTGFNILTKIPGATGGGGG